ncbi:TIGR02186 family protein [Afifella pfennigii]|uniref:TIGR02186 family protein n=1 Tax=Afifella pfennigii TaxID=209897 RepID=UPI00054F1C97|nr:TIGR02186 family protein [Afifella pfennigii]
MMRLLIALLAVLLAVPASAEKLVSALSEDAVEITSNFTGSYITVFGAVTEEEVRGQEYEVAIVVAGPDLPLVVRKKDRVAGLWLNTQSREFFDVPSFYVVHLSENLSVAASQDLLTRYKLDFVNLGFSREASYAPEDEAFARAVVDIKQRQELYAKRGDAVEFLAPNVFRTSFHLPSAIPVGTYHVSVYLFREEQLLAAQVQSLVIEKSGFSDRIASFADQQPLFYGLFTVVVAITTGWLAGLIFRRN